MRLAISSRWIRVFRGALASSFATFVALFSHILGGGASPSGAAVALSLALSTLVCVALASRTLSLWRTAVSVGASQFAFHALFSGIGGSANSAGSSTMVQPGHLHGVATAGSPLVETMAGMPVGASGAHSEWMWMGHLVAALLTVIALRRGAASLRDFRETVALVFTAVLTAVRPVRLAPDVAAPQADWSRSELPRDLSIVMSGLRHRGPPAGTAA